MNNLIQMYVCMMSLYKIFNETRTGHLKPDTINFWVTVIVLGSLQNTRSCRSLFRNELKFS